MAVVGLLVVIGAVIGGYIMEHGALGVLNQPAEFVIIFGAALGTVIAATPLNVLIQTLKTLPKVIAGPPSSKKLYVELLGLLYDLSQVVKRDGMLALEGHIEEPEKSSIFTKYPSFIKNHHAVDFLADTVKVLLTGSGPEEIEPLLDADLDAHHEEGARPATVFSKVGDTMPGLGVVAAVLGIVITMQAIDGPPEEIGHKVGAALVGTFLGILAAYGFFQPLASSIEAINQSESRYMHCIKEGLLALAKGMPPMTVVEFARRSIFSEVRPTFKEMEEILRKAK